MVRKVITLLFLLTSWWCLAEEALIIREAVATTMLATPPSHVDYQAWSQSATAFNDQELLNLLFEEYQDHFFEAQIPTLRKLEALEHDFPTCDSLLNFLAWNRYRMGVDLEYALTLAKKIEDHTESTYDTLGVLKLKCGYPADALQIFLDVLPHMYIALPPDPKDNIPAYYTLVDCIASVISYDHAGDVFYKNGHLREAAKLWQEAHQLIQRMRQTFNFDVGVFPIYDFNYPRFQQKFKAIRSLLKAQRATLGT